MSGSDIFVDDRDPSIVYTGPWTQGGVAQEYDGTSTTAQTNASVLTFHFTGSQVSVRGTALALPDDGQRTDAIYYIDDLPGLEVSNPVLSGAIYKFEHYRSPLLSAGQHVLRITPIVGEQYYIIDYMQVTPGGVPASSSLSSSPGSSSSSSSALGSTSQSPGGPSSFSPPTQHTEPLPAPSDTAQSAPSSNAPQLASSSDTPQSASSSNTPESVSSSDTQHPASSSAAAATSATHHGPSIKTLVPAIVLPLCLLALALALLLCYHRRRRPRTATAPYTVPRRGTQRFSSEPMGRVLAARDSGEEKKGGSIMRAEAVAEEEDEALSAEGGVSEAPRTEYEVGSELCSRGNWGAPPSYAT